MKTCRECLENKPLSEFGKRSDGKKAYKSSCKACIKLYMKNYSTKNKEYIAKKAKQYAERYPNQRSDYYKNNKEYFTKQSADYHKNNIDAIKARRKKNRNKTREVEKKYEIANRSKILKDNRKYYAKNKDKINKKRRNYLKANRGLCNSYSAKRRAVKLQASPKWLTQFDLDYIKNLYVQAKLLEQLDGIARDVDHIVTLISPIVCGLHVPWNLQILSSSENRKKSNKLLK